MELFTIENYRKYRVITAITEFTAITAITAYYRDYRGQKNVLNWHPYISALVNLHAASLELP